MIAVADSVMPDQGRREYLFWQHDRGTTPTSDAEFAVARETNWLIRYPKFRRLMMDMEVTLGENLTVDAHYHGFTIATDQPISSGGDGSAPTPFALFLASLGTCIGIYISIFCKRRKIPTRDIRIRLSFNRNEESRLIDRVEVDIRLPHDFPERYRDAVIRSAEQCAVKRHLFDPPEFKIRTSLDSPIPISP